jgi:uncharacterized Ntn-hydrolase superfamily protein
VATQNITDPRLGRRGLDLMQAGATAGTALVRLREEAAPYAEYRQLALVDAAGGTASFSGSATLGLHRAIEAPSAVAAGNLLADVEVPEKMLAAFLDRPQDDLGDRLLAAMRAGRDAGGEVGPVHSAGLLLVRDTPFPLADLRVDWDEADPIEALTRLWALYRPQMEAYVIRALDPAAAPSYGVPGER